MTMRRNLHRARPDTTYWQKDDAHMWRLLTNESQPQCIAILAKVGRGPHACWRAAICRPAPQWFTPRFVSAESASYALAKLGHADDAWCAATLHTPADTHWQSDFDCGWSRLAGGLQVAVRLVGREWQCMVEGAPIGRAYTSAHNAREWFDNLMVSPAPTPFVHAVEGCVQAARVAHGSANALKGSMPTARLHEHAADVFVHTAMSHLVTLRTYGLDDAGQDQIIAAVMKGQRLAVWMRPFAAVFV